MAANLKRSASDSLSNDRPAKRVADSTCSNAENDTSVDSRTANGASVSPTIVVANALPLDELLAIAGELSIARLHEDYAKQEVDRCIAEHKSSERLYPYPSFIELRATALKKAQDVLLYRQEKVRMLTAQISQYREAFDQERKVQEELLVTRMSRKIASSVEDNIRSELQQKTRDIETLKLRIQQNFEATTSQTTGFKKEVETLKCVYGNFKRDTSDLIKQTQDDIIQNRDDFRARLATIAAEAHAADASCRAPDAKFSAKDVLYASSTDLENHISSTTDFSITWAAELSKVGQQVNDVLRRFEIVSNLESGHNKLRQQVHAMDDRLIKVQDNSNTSLNKPAVSCDVELQEMKGQITQIRKDIGSTGDDDGTEPSGLWGFVDEQLGNVGNENGVGRSGLWGYMADVGFSVCENGVPSGLFAKVEQLQDDLSRISNVCRAENDVEVLVTRRIEGLSNRFDDIIKDVVQKQTTTVFENFAEVDNRITPCLDAAAEFKAFEKEAEAQFSDFEAQVVDLTTLIIGLRHQISSTEPSLPEAVVTSRANIMTEERLRRLEEKTLLLQENIWQKLPTPPLQTSTVALDVKYADMKTEIEVVAEACRSLEDRYNNTTSESVVQAMCHELDARFGFQLYMNQVTANRQVIAKVQNDFVQLKQQLGVLGDDLAGRLVLIERGFHDQRSSIAELVHSSSIQESSAQQFQAMVKKETDEFKTKVSNAMDSQLEKTELAHSMMKNDLDLLGARSTTLEQSWNGCQSQFTRVGQKLSNMDNRVGDLETQFENAEKRVAGIESNRTLDVEECKRKFSNVSSQINKSNEQVAGKSDLLAIHDALELLGTKVTQLETDAAIRAGFPTAQDVSKLLETRITQVQSDAPSRADFLALHDVSKALEMRVTQVQNDAISRSEFLAHRDTSKLLERQLAQVQSDIVTCKQIYDRQASEAREQQAMSKPTNTSPVPSSTNALATKSQAFLNKPVLTEPRPSSPVIPLATFRTPQVSHPVKREGSVTRGSPQQRRGRGRPRKDDGKDKEEVKGHKNSQREKPVKQPRATNSSPSSTSASSPPRAASEEL